MASWSKVSVRNLRHKLEMVLAEMSRSFPSSGINQQYCEDNNNSSSNKNKFSNEGYCSMKRLDFYTSFGTFELDRRDGIIRAAAPGLFLRSAGIIQVSARTFKTVGGKEVTEIRDPRFLNRFSHTSVDGKLNELLKGLPPTEANKLKLAFAEGYKAANSTIVQNVGNKGKGYKSLRFFIKIFLGVAATITIGYFTRDWVIHTVQKQVILNTDVERRVAYHEAGVALVTLYTKHTIPLHKVTIAPEGQQTGRTESREKVEKFLFMTQAEIMAHMDVAMAGRVTEELIYGADRVTIITSNYLKKATELATQMVKTFGMSEKVGLRAHIDIKEISSTTLELIDKEINRLLQESYERTKKILIEHSEEHKALAEALIKKKTLNALDIKKLLSKLHTSKTVPAVTTANDTDDMQQLIASSE